MAEKKQDRGKSGPVWSILSGLLSVVWASQAAEEQRGQRNDCWYDSYAMAASRSFTETTFEHPGSSMVMP